MARILNRRFIILQIIVIILISSILIPSVNSKETTSSGLKTNYEKSRKHINIILSSEDADLLLGRFYEIEQNYVGIDKIKKQIETLEKNNVVSDDISNRFLETMVSIDNSNYIRSKNKGVFIGPTIISHFIPRGSIIGTSFNRSWYYNNFTRELTGFLEGTILDGVIGALPIYTGFSLKPVFITAVGRSCSGVYSRVFFPFFEIMLPCIGFSVRIKNDSGEIFFEYNLDFCLFSVLKGYNYKP